MNTQEIIEMDSKYVMQTYKGIKWPSVKVKILLWDADGNSYIDCVAGIAVNNVGHSWNPKAVKHVIRLKSLFTHLILLHRRTGNFSQIIC